MTRRGGFATVLTLLGTGCSAVVSPIPVQGTLDQIVGEWEGRYISGETGREGTIWFRLDPGKDTATGDVFMTMNRYPQPSVPERPDDLAWQSPVRTIPISFVRCDRDEVSGWMQPYPDPDTGELMYTDFSGVVRGDTLSGTFTAYGEKGGRRSSGTWSVVRRRPRTSQEPWGLSVPATSRDDRILAVP